ncbi:MAG: hypothetical protein JWM54_2352 [Acidobacteriaceae bacterium]|nr:hypothetical protein [Acidobacteriaceae bacterium]
MASSALLAVYRLAQRITGQTAVAAATTLLTALYPVWFAQSTLAHADLMAAAFTLWGLVCFTETRSGAYLEHRPGDLVQDSSDPPAQFERGAGIVTSAVFFALAALSKETAVCTPMALAAYELSRALRVRGERLSALRNAAVLLASVLPLCGWYVYHWRRTGFALGNPEFLRYNAEATLSPLRILLALFHRLLHLTAHVNLFVPVFCGLAALLLLPRQLPDGSTRPSLPRALVAPLLWVVVANTLLFSVLGGALLTRYLLPLYPLVLLCCATFWRRVPAWGGLVALSAFAFVLGLFFNPPYRFAPEDNLSYADAIQLDRQAIHQAVTRYPHETVLTAWPVSDELTKPELGYMKWAIPVVAIDNFSLPEVQRASATGGYSVGIVFSTKYDPPHGLFSLGVHNEAFDRQYFGFHNDLSPEAIASMLGGKVVWRGERKGQWAAVIHFDRPQEAHLSRPPDPGLDRPRRPLLR